MSQDGWPPNAPPPSESVVAWETSKPVTSGKGAVAHGTRIRRPSGPGVPRSSTWILALPALVATPADGCCTGAPAGPVNSHETLPSSGRPLLSDMLTTIV